MRALAHRAAAAPMRKTESFSLTSFHDFGLDEAITRALAEEKYLTPTPIQAQTIPLVMSRRDVIGIAQTGTGKTAAFALPILHHLAANPRPRSAKAAASWCLARRANCPARSSTASAPTAGICDIRTALAIGGVPMGGQVRALLNGVDVLVATPGRLLDLVKSNALRLGDVEFLVLDEADRMLDMGFIHDIRKIVAKLPAKRQTLLFSATMPHAIAELAAQMLRDPVKVAVTPVASTVERVEQRVIRVDRAAKPAILVDVLRREAIDRALIFTRTKHGADKVVRGLVKAGIAAEAIHGNKSQNQRERVLAAFRKGEVRTLVATDIAARGIDVDGISHVVNFDLPNVPETYVHRIGRTARAGAEGSRSRCATPRRWRSCAISRSSSACPFRRPTPRAASGRAAAAQRHAARPAAHARATGGMRRNVDAARPQRHAIIRGSRSGIASVAFLQSQCPAAPRARSRRPRRTVMQKDHDVAKEELLQFEGLVTEILPDARYRVELDDGHVLVAYTAGRMKKNRIKTLAGDRVTVEMSPYDLEKGRLIFRHKDERAGSASRPPQRNQFPPAVTAMLEDAPATTTMSRQTQGRDDANFHLQVRGKSRSAGVRRRSGRPPAAESVQSVARGRRHRARPGPSAQSVARRDRNGHQRSWLSALAHEQKDRG